MVFVSLRVFCSALAIATLLAGCSDDDASEASGTAPQIADLSYTPTTLKVGAQAIVQGRIAFEDADADVAELTIELRTAAGTQAMKPQKTNTTGIAKGELQLVLVVTPPAAGDYDFSVYVIDAQGHASNRLTGTVHAE